MFSQIIVQPVLLVQVMAPSVGQKFNHLRAAFFATQPEDQSLERSIAWNQEAGAALGNAIRKREQSNSGKRPQPRDTRCAAESFLSPERMRLTIAGQEERRQRTEPSS